MPTASRFKKKKSSGTFDFFFPLNDTGSNHVEARESQTYAGVEISAIGMFI
jgi:hypothetical protein